MGKHHTDQEWLAIIQECRSSGLSDRAWLSDHPEINKGSFYRSIRRLRSKACDVPERTSLKASVINEVVGFELDSLHEVSHIEAPAAASNGKTPALKTYEPDPDRVVIQLEYHGIHMGITNAASGSAIAHAIAALQKLC